ncbi:MAG: WD40/YVTN/BNR-like repeat-containing protein [Verrucomicrobiia bacterium]
MKFRLALVFIVLLLARYTLQGAPDVTFWAVHPTGTTAALRSVAYGAPGFVVVGDHGTILFSSESGLQAFESSTTNDLTGLAWGSSDFVAVGTAGAILTSSDGRHWTRRESHIEERIRCITFGNDRFLALGSTNSLISSDGITWSSYAIPAMNPESVCYGNGRFVSVGGTSVHYPSGGIRESVDGQTWKICRRLFYGCG